MTEGEIRERLDEIRNLRRDFEAAHVLEDKLRHDFILYVSTLDGPTAALARLVLTSEDIPFQRECA